MCIATDRTSARKTRAQVRRWRVHLGRATRGPRSRRGVDRAQMRPHLSTLEGRDHSRVFEGHRASATAAPKPASASAVPAGPPAGGAARRKLRSCGVEKRPERPSRMAAVRHDVLLLCYYYYDYYYYHLLFIITNNDMIINANNYSI